MTAAPKQGSLLKSQCRGFLASQTSLFYCEADAVREETGKSTAGSWRGRGPSTRARIVEITSGKSLFQQGLIATCKDRTDEHIAKPSGELGTGA